MGVLTTGENKNTNMQKLLVASLLLAVTAVVYGQEFPERCGLYLDCICRPDCDSSNEYEGSLTQCFNEGDKCCCANQRCSILGACSCRTGCETDETTSEIDTCPGDGGLDCCCL